jgi:ribosomal protein L1
MNEDAFNLSIRKFLKMVGVTSQREIEHAVARAIESGKLKGSESLPATMTLRIDGLELDVKLEGRIDLE